MKILNLTQHVATPEQIEAGVFEPTDEDKKEIQELLTFEEIPTTEVMETRANILALRASEAFEALENPDEYVFIKKIAMIGGAPYFMSALESALKNDGFEVLYAFSKRESVDQVQLDGSVRKVAVFKHVGFVEV